MLPTGSKEARCAIRILYGIGIALTTKAFMSGYEIFSFDFLGQISPGVVLLWFGAYGGWNDGEG